MKLKELHIRNIASIERADIDFEHGLNDAVTGDPASIFLISGDTGSGKSVILDGISMALYKKTPRIADVANVTKNEYTDTEGESIRVASIEQYTRLGISEKDDCYSEVVFEGNDCQTYHARLTLGVKLGSKDKNTGIRSLKHRSPLWEMRVGDGDWTKDSVEQTIQQAVGLDFQQFGRMAMLAQGQFANFLTGDKKEREAILEQLTNTQHFSAYGEAIQSLWKKAKAALATIQAQYDTEKPHTMDEQQVEQIANGLAENQALFEKYGKDIETTEGKLKQVEAVLRNEALLTEAIQAKHELEEIIAGEEYRRSKALFTDWDRTTAQRHQLSDLIKARQDEIKVKQDLSQAKDTFSLLTADMTDRLAKAKQQEEAIRQLEGQIAKQACYETLYAKAGETDLKISQYLDKVAKADILTIKIKQEKDQTEELKKAEEEANKLAQDAAKAVNERQNQIDQLNKKRSELNPQTLNNELKKQNARKQSLTDLLTTINNLIPDTQEHDTLQATLLAEQQVLNTLQDVCQKANDHFLTAQHEADKASKRLTTMKMSLDDKIKLLRHQLYEQHADNCPLCGQHIQHIHLDDEFHNMLTPLEQEQHTANDQLRKATQQRDLAIGNLKQAQGSYNSKHDLLQKNKRKIEQTQNAIHQKATLLGLDLHKDLSPQIQQALAQLATNIAQLEATLDQAERLQNQINTLLQEKKPFDDKKTEAQSASLKAEMAVKANADTISRMESQKAELLHDSDAIKVQVNLVMAGYPEDWQKNTDHVRRRLKDEAKAYFDQQQLLSDRKKEYEKTLMLTNTLVQYSEEVLRVCPDWPINTTAQPYPFLSFLDQPSRPQSTRPSLPPVCRAVLPHEPDINAEWTNFLSRVTALLSKLKDTKAIISASQLMLNAYYQETGHTEHTLTQLIASEHQVLHARTFVTHTDAQLKSRIDAITQAERFVASVLNELQLTNRTLLPDKQVLQDHKASLSQQRDEVLANITQAKTKLDLHQKNVRRLKEIEAQLDKARRRFVRWDTLNRIFGGTRFRTLVQTHILRPLLNNANVYLQQITDRYRLTCSHDNEQLSILVLDRYNKDQVRSVTVLSGGERFMISLALSLALSSLKRTDMSVNILFIDEGFGTLDEKSLDSVMSTLEKLQEIAGQTNRRVGIISHREELEERIPTKIKVIKRGEGRSTIELSRLS